MTSIIIASLPVAFMILMLIINFFWILNVQIEMDNRFYARCNREFGYGNYKIIEITGTGVCKGYIGQCWDCDKK